MRGPGGAGGVWVWGLGGDFGVLEGENFVAGGGGAGHVELAEGALVFVDLPFVEEAEGSHAET